ncbi:hypothetical protein MW887_002793 [Aspergillus wentii]|nr:hypothetical protein MW887_002793 [Aspergillus wentii]
MPTQPPLPHLLAPYVSSLPESSLTVLSSVLGATGNWLVLRFLYAALSASSGAHASVGADGGKKKKVVFGLDLARLSDKGQFAFVDGLSELFYAPATTTTPAAPVAQPGALPPRTVLPVRSQPGAVPGRSPQPAAPISNGSLNRPSTGIGPAKHLHFSGRGTAALDALEKDIAAVIQQVKNTKGSDEEDSEILLIVDQPDLLLAATGPSKGIGATEMGDWIMGLQQNVSSTLLTLSSDSPLIHNTPALSHYQATPLETEHAAFAVGSAHRAERVMQLRNLETGAARDVSGVLRISKGGAWGGSHDNGEGSWDEKEVLYFIQRDGGVSVFGRGE